MNTPQNRSLTQPVSEAEATLKLIANLPVPDGLVDRVQSRLRTAPQKSQVLSWPATYSSAGNWMRGAAAAAIVCVVAGGGWTVYSRVQPAESARVIVVPARSGGAGGFSSAGAMRTPDTLNGPVLHHPVAPPVEENVVAKVPVSPATTPAQAPHHKAKKARQAAAQGTAK